MKGISVEKLEFWKGCPGGFYRHRLSDRIRLNKDGNLNPEDREIHERGLRYLHSNPEEGYVRSPEEFFERWINTRSGKEPRLIGSWCGGFELQLPQAKIFKASDRNFLDIDGLVIASDFGYTGDFSGRLVFGINHLTSQRVLIYRTPLEKVVDGPAEVPSGEKQLLTGSIYGWGGPVMYPFSSLNPSKSAESTYSLVNIEPEKVYETLREIGFKW